MKASAKSLIGVSVPEQILKAWPIASLVTANFIKEPGLEVNRPDAETANIQDNAAILIAIGSNDDVFVTPDCHQHANSQETRTIG